MTNGKKILNILEALQERQIWLEKRLSNVEQGREEIKATLHKHTEKLDHLNSEVSHIHTVLKTVATRGDVEAAVEAGNAQLKADFIRKIQSHERRITNLEEKTDTPNPEKN